MKTVRAHYDGKQVLLDEPLSLKENDELLVTLMEKKENLKHPFPGFTKEEIERVIGTFPLGGNALEDTERLYE